MSDWPTRELLAVYDPPRVPDLTREDPTAWSAVSEVNMRGRHERVQRHHEELAAEGVYVFGYTATGELRYFSTDQEKGERLLLQRFGAGTALRYLGALRRNLRAHPFGSWLADGLNLHVFYALPHNGEEFAGCVAVEDDDYVLVSLMIVDWLGMKTLIGGFTASHATVTLGNELGGRPVIDNFNNHRRPHWTTAAAVPLPRPQDL